MEALSNHRLFRAVALMFLLGLAGTAVAGRPTKPPPTPPAADVAYLSISNSGFGSSWLSAAVRGIEFDAEGEVRADSELWKTTERFVGSIAWDPDGQYLFWAQTINKRGSRGLVMAAPGESPRTIFVQSSTDDPKFTGLSDFLVSGPGCGSTPVLYFWGGLINWPVLWVLDPFAASPQPQVLFVPDPPPPTDVGGTLHGLAISPLGRQLAFGSYSEALGDRAVLTLPLNCPAVGALPAVAGPPQALFAARVGDDKAEIQSLDWSTDGRRLVAALRRWVNYLVYDPELWVAELNYSASDGVEQVSIAGLQHVAAGAVTYPSWAPSAETASCDRLAFNRGGSVWLLDVPRAGFSDLDCAIGAPAMAGGDAVAALDWR